MPSLRAQHANGGVQDWDLFRLKTTYLLTKQKPTSNLRSFFEVRHKEKQKKQCSEKIQLPLEASFVSLSHVIAK